MKKSGIQLSLLILTFASLIALVVIQISWILKAAAMQEAQFNYSVEMAMNRIVENIARDKAICSEVSNCLKEGNKNTCYLLMKNREEWANMGSIIKKDLKYYGIGLDFSFDITEISPGSEKVAEKGVYVSADLVNALQQSGYELRIKFPEKKDFILAQVGYIFVCSLALLILVTLSFMMIFSYYRKEKRLTENIIDFINNMTHEFKTPLTNIALANSMISKTGTVEKDEKLTFYSKVIKSEHDKLKQRVEELLKTSFTETGGPAFDEIIDVSLVIENIIETYTVRILEKDGTFSFAKEGDSFNVKGNIDMFHIAIGNIIDNAIKYCIKIPAINIRVISGQANLSVEITDNGIGITKDKLTLIFDKYYRVPTGDIHNINGFGLGLYHVKSIIEKMGGSIKVTSSKRTGTVFFIELPLADKNE
jgi:two-component system phosphate regulon sensor histidine kinase PhoR